MAKLTTPSHACVVAPETFSFRETPDGPVKVSLGIMHCRYAAYKTFNGKFLCKHHLQMARAGHPFMAHYV